MTQFGAALDHNRTLASIRKRPQAVLGVFDHASRRRGHRLNAASWSSIRCRNKWTTMGFCLASLWHRRLLVFIGYPQQNKQPPIPYISGRQHLFRPQPQPLAFFKYVSACLCHQAKYEINKPYLQARLVSFPLSASSKLWILPCWFQAHLLTGLGFLHVFSELTVDE